MISIVMPVKNAAPFLEECIDSIINQSYIDWELIAVNDHSSDESFDLISDYAKEDGRIKVFNNKGSGIIEALRMAFSKSQGQYISRMDADDIMPTNKLEILLMHLTSQKAPSVCIGKVEYFSEHDLGEGYQKYAQWLNDLTIQNRNFLEIYKECVVPSPNWLMRKIDFIKIGAFDSEFYPEDYDLCFRMRAGQLNICGVNQVTHLWRDHKSRASRNDENYKDNQFLSLKLHYFLKLDYQRSKQLVLWGAGKKGKKLAKKLIKQDIPFKWISNNVKKQGIKIYDQLLFAVTEIKQDEEVQVIIAVATRDSKNDILRTLDSLNLNDYNFFC